LRKTKVKKQRIKLIQLEPRNKDIIYLEDRLGLDGVKQFIQWSVELKSNSYIQENLEELYKIQTSRAAVWRLRNSKKWKPIIARLRKKLEKNILKVPCANKLDRMLTLQKVIDEGMKWSLKNITKEGDSIYELKLGAVTKATKEAREEMDGIKITHSLSLAQMMKELSDAESNGEIK